MFFAEYLSVSLCDSCRVFVHGRAGEREKEEPFRCLTLPLCVQIHGAQC